MQKENRGMDLTEKCLICSILLCNFCSKQIHVGKHICSALQFGFVKI